MSNRLEGKLALVTGGAQGIGEACAWRLAREGAKIVIMDIDESRANTLAGAMRDHGHDAFVQQVDLTDAGSIRHAFDRVAAQFGPLRIAVNNAGAGTGMVPLSQMTDDQWDRTITLNLTGVFRCLREQVALMRDHGGAIVNVASIFGLTGGDRLSAYCASKHGVVGLTKAAAIEFGPLNIRVNAVAPTFVQTKLTGNLDTDTWQRLIASHALGRIPSPDDVAAMVAWLSSDDACAVTGSIHQVDAGYLAD